MTKLIKPEEREENSYAVEALRRQQEVAIQQGFYPDSKSRARLKAGRKRNAGNFGPGGSWSKDSTNDGSGSNGSGIDRSSGYGTGGYGSGSDRSDADKSSAAHPGGAADADSSKSGSTNRGYHGNPGLASSKLGTGPSKYDPQPLQAILGRLTNSLGWSRTLNVATIAARWPQIVGTAVAQHCTVETFNDNVLVVRASSTAWANQMKLLLPTLERNIRQTLGTNAVKQVIIRGPEAPSWKKGPLHIPGRGPRDTYG